MFEDSTASKILAAANVLRQKSKALEGMMELKITSELEPKFRSDLRQSLSENIPLIQSMLKAAKAAVEDTDEEYEEIVFEPDVEAIVQSLQISRRDYLLLEYGDIRYGVTPLQTFSRIRRSFT